MIESPVQVVPSFLQQVSLKNMPKGCFTGRNTGDRSDSMISSLSGLSSTRRDSQDLNIEVATNQSPIDSVPGAAQEPLVAIKESPSFDQESHRTQSIVSKPIISAPPAQILPQTIKPELILPPSSAVAQTAINASSPLMKKLMGPSIHDLSPARR
jgi:hypothetical protein